MVNEKGLEYAEGRSIALKIVGQLRKRPCFSITGIQISIALIGFGYVAPAHLRVLAALFHNLKPCVGCTWRYVKTHVADAY